MANANSTATLKLLEAHDLLCQTETMVSFIQSITLINNHRGDELSLSCDQVTGLYYVLNNVRDNLKAVGKTIDAARLEIKHHD